MEKFAVLAEDLMKVGVVTYLMPWVYLIFLFKCCFDYLWFGWFMSFCYFYLSNFKRVDSFAIS
jgi:hypothetical protein